MAYESPRQKIPISIAGPYYESDTKKVNAQTAINWYPEVDNIQGKTAISMAPTPGTSFVKSVGTGPHRGATKFKNNAYFVSGNELIKMDTLENTTSIGNIDTSSGLVSMATNGVLGGQLMLVDGEDGWIYNESTLAKITDADFPANPVMVDYMDSFFICIFKNSPKFYISDVADGTAWDALDFATAERDPDNIVAVAVHGRNLWLIGETTTEVWTNTGGEFPFEPYRNGFSEIGTMSRWSVAKSHEGLIWLANDNWGNAHIVKSDGVGTKVISNAAVEHEFDGYSTLLDARAFVFQQEGHTFYQITFPSENVTWVCDLSQPNSDLAWHKRRTGSTGRHLAETHIYYNNTHYIGSYASSNLLKLDYDVHTDYFNNVITPIFRERTGTHLHSGNNNRVVYYDFELEINSGKGLTSGQGSDPILEVNWSDDGGNTWSNTRHLKAGKKGEYNKRLLLHHLGSSRDRIFRVKQSDPVPIFLLAAYANIEELAH